VAALVLVSPVGGHGVASANLQAHASMSPSVIHYPRTRAITFRLRLTTGDDAHLAYVTTLAPSYASPRLPTSLRSLFEDHRRWLVDFVTRGRLRPAGSPVTPVRLRAIGAGTRVPIPAAPSGGPGIGLSIPSCDRGFPRIPQRIALRLPPRSSTTVIARYRTAHVAPWIDTDYRVTFDLQHRREDEPGWTWHTRVVRPAVARRVGGTAVRLELSRRGGVWAPLGQRIRLSGRTIPPEPGEPLRILYRAWRQGAHAVGPARVLAYVRTDRLGHFRYVWPARRRLRYEVWAAGLPDHRAAGAKSCSAWFRVSRRRVRTALT
jgi:hypothetical protein